MKIPNAQAAYIERSKLTEYLLSTTHPVGRSKAVFFRTLGFADDRVGGLEQGLVAIAKTEEVVEAERSEYGYEVYYRRADGHPWRSGRARTNCLDHRPRRGETAFCHCLSVIREGAMIHELDTVVLAHDIPGHGLKMGDVGAVVHVYAEAYEVEFVTAEGKTVAVLTLTPEDIRPMRSGEILHARELASA